jgi:hypothetical protein
LVKAEHCEDSSPNCEPGAGKFSSDGEKIIVAHFIVHAQRTLFPSREISELVPRQTFATAKV